MWCIGQERICTVERSATNHEFKPMKIPNQRCAADETHKSRLNANTQAVLKCREVIDQVIGRSDASRASGARGASTGEYVSCAVFDVTVPKNVLASSSSSSQVPMAMRDKRRIRVTLNQDRICSAVQRRIMPRDDEHE